MAVKWLLLFLFVCGLRAAYEISSQLVPLVAFYLFCFLYLVLDNVLKGLEARYF